MPALPQEFIEATQLAAQLKAELDLAKKELATAREKADESRNIIMALETENVGLKNGLTSATEELSASKLREASLSEQIEALSSEVADLRDELSTTTEWTNELITEKKALSDELAELEESYSTAVAERDEAVATKNAVKDQFETINSALDVRGIDAEIIDSKTESGDLGVPTLSPAVKRYFEIYKSKDPNLKSESFRLYNQHKSEIDAEKNRRGGAATPDQPASAVTVTDEDKSAWATYGDLKNQLAAVSTSRTLSAAQRNKRYSELKIEIGKFYLKNKESIDRYKSAFELGYVA
jgi:chromosome segregation ATPase